MSNHFGLLREISRLSPSTYENRMFLTLDVDWAPDFVIREVSELLQSRQISATWFITHDSPAVRELDKVNIFEIGVHPNFSPLLMGGDSATSIKQIVNFVRQLSPSAVSFRSHSLVQSTPLLDLMGQAGFENDCNVFLPFTPPESLFPWRHGENITRIPYCWEDDTWLMGDCRSPEEIFSSKGLRVVDIHPIHLWLNSENLDAYQSIRHDQQNEELLRSYCNHVQTGRCVMAAFNILTQ